MPSRIRTSEDHFYFPGIILSPVLHPVPHYTVIALLLLPKDTLN